MAKETGEHESKAADKREGAAGESKEGGGKKKRMHLHEIRSTQAQDGSIIHHHTYKASADQRFSEPERGPVATSSSPEEAGQHVAEQFGMNQMGGGDAAAGAAPAAGGGDEAMA